MVYGSYLVTFIFGCLFLPFIGWLLFHYPTSNNFFKWLIRKK